MTQPVRQRLVIVLPSTGEFDSRTYRIATTCLERGHEVTVLARWSAGLAREELAPGGYRIVRVPASAVDGLPLPWLFAAGRRALRWRHSRREGTRRGRSGHVDGTSGARQPGRTGAATPSPLDRPHRASPPRRLFSGLVRRLAIPLTIRSHVRNARAMAPQTDLFHGMAYMGIPVALDLARRQRARVVYDARDIYLEARNLARMRGPARWLLARAERRWARQADRVITVNDAYADVMIQRLRVPRPLVVMNCSYRFDPPEPRQRRFHEALDLDATTRVVLYHGGLFPDRGIEQLMEAIRAISGAVLVLMGYGALESELREQALEPELAGRVRVMAAVPPSELHAWVACADVVAMPIQPSTMNHRLTTPNKLFEAMAAGVPVVASDLPGMAAIVRETDCGVLVDPTDIAGIAEAIRTLLESPPDLWNAYRRRAIAAAQDTYNWERQVGALLAEYGRLTGLPW